MSPKSYSYTLKNPNGGWLGQIVITDDGMFGAVTDWGNFSYAWRSFGDNFKVFLSELGISYFAEKMVTGLAYSIQGKKVEKASYLFAEHILPALQKVLKEELNNPVKGREE